MIVDFYFYIKYSETYQSSLALTFDSYINKSNKHSTQFVHLTTSLVQLSMLESA